MIEGRISVAGAILLAGVLIALAIALESIFSARYQMASASGATGGPFVWRLDVRTGEVRACVAEGYNNRFADCRDKAPAR